MKRMMAVLLALALLCPALALGEATAAQAMTQCFQGVSGNVRFALPGTPLLIWDVEAPGFLTGSRQLFGYCDEHGAEFQLRAGDIAGMLDKIREGRPDTADANLRLGGLMNYAMMVPNSYGAELEDYSASYDDETGSALVEFWFTYPDAPGVQYYGKATLEDTWATTLILQDCPDAQKLLDSMVFLREETAVAYRAAHSERTQANLHGLQMTFPCAPTAIPASGKLERVACFSLDWCVMDVQYQPVVIAIEGDDEEVMKTVAEKVLLPTIDAEEILNPVLTVLPDGSRQLDFEAQSDMLAMGNDYGNRHVLRCRVIAGEGGLWSIVTDDSETGAAFLDSMELKAGNSEIPAEAAAAAKPVATATDLATGTDLPGTAGEAKPVTFMDLIASLNDGLEPDRFDVGIRAETLHVSEAFYSGERWVRGLYPEDIATGVALVYTAGPDLEDGVCEIRVLDAGTSPRMMSFARLCAWSLCGGEEALADLYADEKPVTVRLDTGSATAGYTDHPYSSLAYSWVSVIPDGAPAVRVVIPEPDDGGGLDDMTEFSVSRAEFETNMAALLPMMGLPPMETDETEDQEEDGILHWYAVGDNYIMAWTATGAGTDPIDFVAVQGYSENAPQVFGLTMAAFVACAGGNEEILTQVAMLLTESPTWGELCDLWPLLSDGRIACILQEEEDIFGTMAVGIVFRAPDAE